MKNKITIYTDGSARGNPGPAGWAAVFIAGRKVFEIGGRVEHATNNQMELRAAIEALKYMKENKIAGEIKIIADAKYVVLGITEWIPNWLRNNWRGANKKPVMNREFWEELYELDRKFKPKWDYVKGHHEDKWNNRADEIATSFADNEPVKLRA
ncbi:MAG: ribonuclease H [Patescibacteria group bacterium]